MITALIGAVILLAVLRLFSRGRARPLLERPLFMTPGDYAKGAQYVDVEQIQSIAKLPVANRITIPGCGRPSGEVKRRHVAGHVCPQQPPSGEGYAHVGYAKAT
jgi:hypothetical protein